MKPVALGADLHWELWCPGHTLAVWFRVPRIGRITLWGAEGRIGYVAIRFFRAAK